MESIDLLLKSGWLAVSRMYSDQAKIHGLTAVQALTLLKIDPKTGTRSTNLGPKMAIEPTSLTRIIKILEDEGFIYKDKSNADKREVIIKLTDKGLSHRNLSKEIVMSFNQMVLDKIEPEEFETFKKVMGIVTQFANEQNHSSNKYRKVKK
jgi:MarR family transcriptional regulator, organic hydroperoxide resistance regulator